MYLLYIHIYIYVCATHTHNLSANGRIAQLFVPLFYFFYNRYLSVLLFLYKQRHIVGKLRRERVDSDLTIMNRTELN